MIYLGSISMLTTEAKNNTNTAVPFVLPTTGKITLQSDTAGAFAALGFGAAFVATAAAGRRLDQYTPATMLLGHVQRVLGIINPTGGTVVVKVFWEPSS